MSTWLLENNIATQEELMPLTIKLKKDVLEGKKTAWIQLHFASKSRTTRISWLIKYYRFNK